MKNLEMYTSTLNAKFNNALFTFSIQGKLVEVWIGLGHHVIYVNKEMKIQGPNYYQPSRNSCIKLLEKNRSLLGFS